MKTGIKIFCIKVFLLLLPFIMLFSWIEFKARDLPNSYALKKENFERLHDSVSILVLGSSHALKGINPDFFSCTGFNFSNSSQSLSLDSWICLKYLPQLPELKAVVIDISCFSFYFDLKDSPEEWRNYFYYRYYGLPVPCRDLPDLRSFSRAALYTRGFLNDLVFNKLNVKEEFGDIQPNGWERTPSGGGGSSSLSNSGGRKRVILHQSLRDEKNFPFILHNLEELLSALEKRKIQVFFVSVPVYQTYSDFLDPANIRENHRILSHLCEMYPASYSDYTHDSRFHPEDFYDNDHLNSKGAEKFSRILDREILEGICNP